MFGLDPKLFMILFVYWPAIVLIGIIIAVFRPSEGKKVEEKYGVEAWWHTF